MKFGIGTYTFPRTIGAGRMSGLGLVATGQELGAQVIQFCENLEDWGDVLELRRAASDAGIQLELGTRGLDAERLKRLSEIAATWETDFIRVVIDHGTDEPTPAEATDRLGALASVLPVRIAIENHDRFPARVLREIVDDAGAWVTLDTANSLGSLEQASVVAEVLAPRVICWHLKDVAAARVPDQLGIDIRGCAVGDGQIAWADLASQLPVEQITSAIVEFWTPSVPEPSRWEMEAARRSMAAVRGWSVFGQSHPAP